MTTNGGAHKFNKNENNWPHKHFEPQQVDVAVSSIQILALDSLSTFARTLSFNNKGKRSDYKCDHLVRGKGTGYFTLWIKINVCHE